MGIVYRVVCPKCNYQRDFNLGGGLNSVNLKRSIRVLEIKEQEIVSNLEEQNQIEHFRIENQLTECIDCKEMKAKTIIRITDKQGNVYQLGNTCQQCGKKAIIYANVTPYQILCPECGEAELHFSEVGYWD